MLSHLPRAAAVIGLSVLIAAAAAPAAGAGAGAASASASVTAAQRSAADPAQGEDPVPAKEPPVHDMEGHDMEGMDMPAEEMPGVETPEVAHADAVSRPRGFVLGTFAAVNAAVLLSAALLRRHTKGRTDRRRPARVAAPATA